MKQAQLLKLNKIIGAFQRVAVAYSGGVDSTLLLTLCADVLGPDNVVAVTGVSQTYTEEEKAAAVRFAKALGVKHVLLETDELACREFVANPDDRCYFCKRELFGKMIRLAAREGASAVLDATNADDLADHRPGRKAAEEAGVVSPFVRAAFRKADIRELSKRLRLTSWDKPANPCLASRIPYGTRITPAALAAIHSGEQFIRRAGFPVVRLRHHGRLAKIEIPVEDFARFLRPLTLRRITAHLKSLGFVWIAFDVEGYRTGSLNASLPALSRSSFKKAQRKK